ncbi:unnamed protein product [Clonostachys byssicola]|uniref:Uncharacterized protein n=1 Tax=Clonostachys byssicola TaxID=160290 RepID=A0A9N9XZU6_9HYPO|nr:unnamed protein product [Clonostachys byssicola]
MAKKLKSKVSQMLGKPKYDKASLADLVMAVSKQTGKDLSQLENVHLKDITEQQTAARINEVKNGREKEETVLYPNEESGDFEKIHDSNWGKSVHRIVDRMGNKEIESIAIPPFTVAQIHPHLNFKLADRPAKEAK